MARNFFSLMRSSAPAGTATPTATAPSPPPNMKQDAAGGVGVHLDPTLEAVRHEMPGDIDMALQLREVSAHYGSFQAIDKISIDVPRNRVTALIGPSGCGKSTLLRCLNRHERPHPRRPDRGSNRLRGPEPARPQRRRRRSPPPDRHGLPETQSLPQVDLRKRRLRRARSTATPATWTASSKTPCAAPPSGTKSKTTSTRADSPSPAASSSASASPAQSPSSPKSS